MLYKCNGKPVECTHLDTHTHTHTHAYSNRSVVLVQATSQKITRRKINVFFLLINVQKSAPHKNEEDISSPIFIHEGNT